MRHRAWITGMAAALVFAASPGLRAWSAPSGQDLAQQGRQVFGAAGCDACHFEGSIVAPSLKGVAGRRIAGVGRYAYSTALKAKAGTWTDANLDAFLADPQGFAPGTEMLAPGTDEPERLAIIAYLKTLR